MVDGVTGGPPFGSQVGPRVGDGEDQRAERDLLTDEPEGVTLTVHPLVVAVDEVLATDPSLDTSAALRASLKALGG